MDCSEIKAACSCTKPAGHDGPHLCVCEGSWNDDGSVVTMPSVIQVGPYKGSRLEEFGWSS